MSLSPAQKWAVELANQIKAIQTSWADDDAQVRQEMIQQELKRALDKLASTEREDCLSALRSHFPIPDGGEVRVVKVREEAPARQVTADEALELLIEASPRLSESQRRTYSERLVGAGYRVLERQAAPPAPAPAAIPVGIDKMPDPLARKLGLKGEPKVYPTQVFNVLLELVDCVLAVAGAASQVLTEMRRRAGEPPASREEDVRAILGQYLTDQVAVSPDRMRLAVDRTRRRMAGFLQAPAELPRDLCEKARTITPETIIEVVTRERKPGILDNKYQMYWDRFVLLWNREKWGVVDDSPVWEKKVAQSVLNTVERGT